VTTLTNFIGGEAVPPASGAYIDDIEPATGRPYARVPDSDARDVDAAVAAARGAFPAWSRTTAAERSRLLLAIADRLRDAAPELARAESVDTGKPLKLAASVDIPRSESNFRFFATAILHTQSELHATDTSHLNYTLRRPVGAVACIAPWNLPLYLLTWKVAPALAAGCTVVAKPSEITPMTAFLLSRIAADAGLPPGVLNVVHGLGSKTGPPLTGHPGIAAISFTGGTQTGRAIAESAAPRFKKLALELGGKNASLVFGDADMEAAVRTGLLGAFTNQGQVCHCGSRILVDRAAYAAYVERFVAATRTLRVGDPLEADTEQGAVVSKAQYDKVLAAIDHARGEGGTIACGGAPARPAGARCKDGLFIQPTVILDLPPDCRTNQEEIFGPVVTISPFDGEDEAVAIANGTRYGLSASVWTRDLARAHRVADRLDTGVVWVNSWMHRDLRVPFGGIKDSGVGREGGLEALHFFTDPKNVCIPVPER